MRRQAVDRNDSNAARAQSWLTLAILMGTYGVHALDRVIFTLLLEPIKHDLALSDTQLGLLSGLAFALFYAALGVPIARLSDTWSRKYVIIISIVVFSAATVGSGMATGFATLLVARLCVGIGEAGPTPAAASILADRFAPALRPLAMSLFTAGALLGSSIGLLSIAFLGGNVDWRGIFWIAGGFGLLMSLIVTIGIREPKRRSKRQTNEPFKMVLRALLHVRSFLCIAVGAGLFSLAVIASQGWAPSFLARTYGFERGQITLFLAFAWGLGGTLGAVLIGIATMRARRKGPTAVLSLLSAIALLDGIFFFVGFASSSVRICVGSLALGFFLSYSVLGPALALVQDMVAPARRATATATFQLIANGIGLGLGPLAAGLLSDAFNPTFGPNSLSLGLLIVITFGSVGGAALLFKARRYIDGDLLVSDVSRGKDPAG
jgi:predicted MFS family arabinose efflux permease